MKKQKVNWSAAFNIISDEQLHFLMSNFMSAIEQEAFLSNLKQFTYELKGKTVIIDPQASRELYFFTRQHTRSIYKILFDMRLRQMLCDPKTRKFLTTPLASLTISVRIYHLLLNEDCKTMCDVAQLASNGYLYKKGLGQKSITYIVELFKQHGCGELFL